MWLCKRPRILSFPNFLSPLECERIVALAQMKGMEADSPVTDGPQSMRTSSSCWLAYNNKTDLDYGCQTVHDEHVLQSIAHRISVASCLPEEHGETFQVLRYQVGQYYKTHPDFFTKHQREEMSNWGGQRIATMLCYLNDVPANGGGETHFPRVRDDGRHHITDRGLTIRPHAGLGILFFNVDTNCRIEPRSIHESLPVLQPGVEKWTLTQWIRQQPYPRPGAVS